MATSRDVRDIMGFTAGGASMSVPAVAKSKKKVPGPMLLGGKKLTGMTREIVALHGDRPPPVAIVDTSKAYRRGFKRDIKASHWERVEFENEARNDGLRLKHWRKQQAPKDTQHPVPAPESNGDAMDIDGQPSPATSAANTEQTTKPYEFARFNVQITVPSFTDEQYEKFLQDPQWSKEETEYLLQVIKDCNQKWPVVADQYEWKTSPPSSQEPSSTAIARPSDIRARDVEALKARYYTVCAKAMEFKLPNGVADMNAEEFSLHELYGKFNPDQERKRKAQAWSLMKRNPEEIKEEEYLLGELQRIMISAQKFETERAELRSRLEHAQPIGNGATAAASGTLNLTSQGLTALYNSLAAQDKNRRPKPRVSLDTLQSPAGAIQPGLTTPASAGGHRDSLSSASYKKGSFSAGGAVPPPTPLRQLNARDEERFGVSTPIERITSGVSFRTDKLLKLRQAKSQIQTQKISQALVQLEIPDLLSLPTTRVVAAFEQLIGKINILLDAKKLLTKEETELATAKSIKEELDRAKAIENGEEVDVEKDADGEEDEEDAEGEEDDAEGEDDDGDTPMTDAPKAEDKVIRPSSSRSNATAGFMRSGSVLSTASSRGSRRKK